MFCEDGVFTVDESRDILRAGRAAGLQPRLHADELGPSGGARLAAELGARSADHLIFVDRNAARAMARAGTVATLLPGAAFYLKLGRFAPARMLIDEGVAVALGTDVNPGGGFTPSMPFVMALACFGMGLTLEEALVAATINAACSVNRERSRREPRTRQADGCRRHQRLRGRAPAPRGRGNPNGHQARARGARFRLMTDV